MIHEYFDVLSDETTEELEDAISRRRTDRNERRRARIDQITDEVEG